MTTKNFLSKIRGLFSASESTDVSLDCRLTVGSPSGLDAKWKQNPFMRFAVVLTLIFTIGVGNAWGATYTGTFSKYTTGTLIDGYYIVVGSSDKAMSSTVNSNKRIEGTNVSISSGTSITNPDNTLVWFIEEGTSSNAGKFTFKNENTSKYLYISANSSGKSLNVGNTAYYHEYDYCASTGDCGTNAPAGWKFTLGASVTTNYKILKWNNSSSWFSGYSGDYTSSMTPVRLFRLPKFRAKTTQPATGSFTASATSATWDGTNKHLSWMSSGATVTLTATPPSGKAVNAWTVTKATGGTVTVTSTGTNTATFSMPADQVTITVTWKDAAPSCSSEITITKGSNPANGTFTISNSGTVCIDGGNASTTVTATPNSHYHLASVTSTGGGSVGAISNNTCTVSNISANTTINVTFAADPTYTVTWVAGSNPSFSTQTNYAGTALSDPGEPSAASYCPGGKEFVGWTATPIVGEGSEPADLFTSVSGKSIPVDGITYYAVFATRGGSGSVTKSDELTYTSFFAACTPSGSNTSGSYTNFSGKSGSESDAVYDGNLFKHGNGPSNCKDYIQMRTSSNSGIIATTSGGKAKKVTVEWNSGTANAKVVNIYGKNTAYSAISDLFSDATDGDLLGTITKGTSTELTITEDYEYIGIRSSDGAIYFDAISIDWQASGGYTYSNYATTCCTQLGSINGSFSLPHT